MCSFSFFLSLNVLLIFFLSTTSYSNSIDQSCPGEKCPKSTVARNEKHLKWEGYDDNNNKATQIFGKQDSLPGHRLENGDINKIKRESDRRWTTKSQSGPERRSESMAKLLDRKHLPNKLLTMPSDLSHSNRLSRMKRDLGSLDLGSMPDEKLSCKDALSCKNRCSSNSSAVVYKEGLSCYCDVHCEFFKDCCSDFAVQCKSSEVKNSSQSHGLPGFEPPTAPTGDANKYKDHQEKWSCIKKIVNSPIRTKGIWMIASCPSSSAKNEDFYKCTNLADEITLDNYQYPPVYTNNGTVYYNKFCAVCNGVELHEVKTYQLSLQCSVAPPQRISQREQLEFVFTHCSGISWKPRDGDPRRYCLRIVSKCTSTNQQWHQECNDTIVGLVNDNECIYKNIKCAKCNDKDISNITCGPNTKNMHDESKKCPGTGGGSTIGLPRPLSVLFDFNGPASNMAKCNSDKVFDHHLGTCRKTLTLPKYSEIEEYKIMLWGKSQNKAPYKVFVALNRTNSSVITEDLANDLDVQPTQIRNFKMHRDDFDTFEFQFDFTKTAFKNNNSGAFDNFFNFTKSFNITIADFSFVVIKATSRALSCHSFQVYSENEYAPADNHSAVYIKVTGELLRREEYYVTGSPANDRQDIMMCRKSTNCSTKWVLMEKEEFVVLKNRSVFVHASKRMYAIVEQFWQNRSLFICENFSNRLSVGTSDDRVSSILTMTCMVISIIALVFVLVTYTLFAELRTTPGMNLINLSVAILLAQVLWLVGSWQTDNPMACTAIAVLLHYFFLVSFTWTAIIAFDTWRAFKTTNSRRGLASSKRSKRLQLLRYMAFGWGSVVVFVGTCLVLDTTKLVSAGYASYVSRGCFITEKWPLVYFFIVPVALIIVVNIVLYALTMKSIHATTAQARVAVDHRNSRQTFWIYLRISSVMGFTWIFGFIAPFGAEFLWYPFIVLNSIQGVYIALAFGLNQRARNLYKHRFPCLALLCNNTSKMEKNAGTSNSEKTQDDADETKL